MSKRKPRSVRDRENAAIREQRVIAERERQESERRQRRTVGFGLLALVTLLVVGAVVGPDLPDTSSTSIALPAVLLIGLTAGGLSCLAVQGGLLTVAVTGERALPGQETRALAGNARPIASFLIAKLVAYTLLGAALGALGQAAQPSVELRVGIQIATALLMIATALHFLGVHPIFRHAIIQPPRALTRRISKTARGGGALAPGMLGAMTVFLPCGVTQAMQLVAINSASPVTGAAILAVFVLGTSPLFFSLGYFATTMSDVAHSRFLKVAGVAILAVATISLDAGLRLGGSPVTFAAAKDALFEPPVPVPARAAVDGIQEARIQVGGGGYNPQVVQVRAGQAARLVFAGDGSAGCALSLVLQDQQYVLSQDGETPIELPAMQAGESIDYTCAMGMYGGRIEAVA